MVLAKMQEQPSLQCEKLQPIQMDQRRRRRHSALITAVLAGLFALIATPVAQAAVYTYANNVSTGENVTRYSGLRSEIRGGDGNLEPYSVDGANPYVILETYHPAPGYRTIGFSQGVPPVAMIHTKATSAHQKCRWDWPWSSGSIGSLKLTCKTR